MKRYTIGKLAKELKINIETVRFYQRKGLLKVPEKIVGPYREYGETDRERIRLIIAAKDLGFKLKEIKDILNLLDGDSNIKELAPIFEKKIKNLESRKSHIANSVEVLSRAVSSLTASGALPSDCLINLSLKNSQ